MNTRLSTLNSPAGEDWRGAVVYRVHTAAFQDSNGDGCGDLAGLTRRLDYIAALGVDVVSLAPFFLSPGHDQGRDISDHCRIDPAFGTLGDFDTLICKAHALGLKISIDQVLGQTSSQHPWFNDSRTGPDAERADWYIWSGPGAKGGPPHAWRAADGGPAWGWDERRGQFFLQARRRGVPALNLAAPAVQEALLETARFWLDHGVDGINVVDGHLLFESDQIDTMVAGPSLPIRPKPAQAQKDFLGRYYGFLADQGAYFGVAASDDGPLTATMTGHAVALDTLEHCRFAAHDMRHCIENSQSGAPDLWPCWSFSNGGGDRHLSRWMEPGIEAAQLAKFAATLLLVQRGTISLFQGEELGLSGRPRGTPLPAPMPWEAGAPHVGFSTVPPFAAIPKRDIADAVSTQDHAESVLCHYRNVLRFRNRHAVLRTGQIEFIRTVGNVLIFVRSNGAERLLFVFNFDNAPVNQMLPEGLGKVTPLPLAGYPVLLHEGTIIMSELDVFCARLDQDHIPKASL